MTDTFLDHLEKCWTRHSHMTSPHRKHFKIIYNELFSLNLSAFCTMCEVFYLCAVTRNVRIQVLIDMYHSFLPWYITWCIRITSDTSLIHRRSNHHSPGYYIYEENRIPLSKYKRILKFRMKKAANNFVPPKHD